MVNNIIIATSQSGKTTELIERCSKDNYSLIVCPNIVMCHNTFKMAKKLGKNIPMPITFYEFVNQKWDGAHIDNFYFDELQLSLDNYANGINIQDIVIDATNTKIEFKSRAKPIEGE